MHSVSVQYGIQGSKLKKIHAYKTCGRSKEWLPAQVPSHFYWKQRRRWEAVPGLDSHWADPCRTCSCCLTTQRLPSLQPWQKKRKKIHKWLHETNKSSATYVTAAWCLWAANVCIVNTSRIREESKRCFSLRRKCTPKLGSVTLNRPKLTELCLPVPSVCTIFDPIFILGQWERDWHLKMQDNYIGQEKIFVFMS